MVRDGSVVLVVGDAAIDWLVRVAALPPAGGNAWADPPSPAAGGSGANVAVTLSRMGLRARFAGRLAADEFGPVLLANLDREGVEVIDRTLHPGTRTPVVFAIVDAAGERTLLSLARGSAQTQLRATDVPATAWEDVVWCHVSGIALAEEPGRSEVLVLMAEARTLRIRVSLDLNLRVDLVAAEEGLLDGMRRAVDAADMVVGSAAEAMAVAGAVDPRDAAARLAQGGSTAVVRVGAEGALLGEAGVVTAVPGFPTASVDQLGAGDAFDAGLIRGLVSGAPAHDAVRHGNAAAALAIGHSGGRGFPGLAELEALLAAPGPE